MCISAYLIVDDRTLAYVPPSILNQATNPGNLLALSAAAIKSGKLRAEWKTNGRNILLAGVLAPLRYVMFLYALEGAAVSVLAPMREIGTVFATLFGILLLKEPFGARRTVASFIITVGVGVAGIGMECASR